MKIIALIQARTGSTRLPKKILKKIKERIILDYVVDRLKYSKYLDNIVLATTISKKDDILEKYAINKKIDYFRGDEENVLSRYYYAAKKYKSDVIVRITSDCPLIDFEIVDKVIIKHIETQSDYTSNVLKRTFPRGVDTEVFNFDVLEESYKCSSDKFEQEHVVPYITSHPEKFKLQNLEAKGKLKRPDIRITLDTKEDFELIKKIILHFGNISFNTYDIIDFLNENQNLLLINKNVQQKE